MTNQTKNKRDSFIFYRSFFMATKCLKNDEKSQFFDAICSYALDGEIGNLDGTAKGMFELVKPQLDANRKRFENGCVKKQNRSKTEAKKKQTKSKTEANVNVNVNHNVNENENLNNNYSELIEGLKFILEEKLNKTISTKNWQKDFSLLIEKDLKEREDPIESVKRCIQAVSDNYGKDYFPVIQSSSSFREKFSKIENFLERSKPKMSKNLQVIMGDW